VPNLGFSDQLWSGNRTLYEKLQKAPVTRQERFAFLLAEQGSVVRSRRPYRVPSRGAERKRWGANFYPEDMKREEFEAWAKTLPAPARGGGRAFYGDPAQREQGSCAVRYSSSTAPISEGARAASGNACVSRVTRHQRNTDASPDAFLSNELLLSDVAWMDLDAHSISLSALIETYKRRAVRLQAGFEAYITIRDDAETDR